MKNGPKRSLSSGTIVFLCLTAGIIVITALFLLTISGKDLSGRQNVTDGQVQMDADIPELAVDEEPEIQTEQPIRISLLPDVPEEPEIRQLTISVAGDVTAPRVARDNTENDTGFADIFVNLDEAFGQADIALCTLETMTDDEIDYDTYNTSPLLLDALKSTGIHYLNLATEHMIDFGEAALDITRAELNMRGINYCGASDSVQMLSVNGISVALLAYTYGISEVVPANQDLSGIPLFSMDRALSDIALARANGANLVIVLPHWGTKNSGDVTDAMRETARQLARAGADMIIGSHSNVVSEMEMLKVERADGRTYEALVCYSLGALLMEARSDENAAGMVLSTEIQYDSGKRQVTFLARKIIPLYIGQTTLEGNRVWRVINISDGAYVETLNADIREGAQAARARVEQLAAGLENGNAEAN